MHANMCMRTRPSTGMYMRCIEYMCIDMHFIYILYACIHSYMQGLLSMPAQLPRIHVHMCYIIYTLIHTPIHTCIHSHMQRLLDMTSQLPGVCGCGVPGGKIYMHTCIHAQTFCCLKMHTCTYELQSTHPCMYIRAML